MCYNHSKVPKRRFFLLLHFCFLLPTVFSVFVQLELSANNFHILYLENGKIIYFFHNLCRLEITISSKEAWDVIFSFTRNSAWILYFYYYYVPQVDSRNFLLSTRGTLGWTLFQKMFGGHNSMSRSTFESHNDKAKQWNYFLLAIKWLQIRCTYIAILIYHNLVTFVIQWHFVIITVYNVDKSGNFVVFF